MLTDFFTAINHIPEREYVLEKLFKKSMDKIITKGNWGYYNKNHISIEEILKKKCKRSLGYFKKANPEVRISERLFKYDTTGEIIRDLYRNKMLISVYEIPDYQLKYFENHRRHSSYITSKLLYHYDD